MNALVSPAQAVSEQPTGSPMLRSLALCDLVDSTELVERLGDQRATALLRRHDRLARDLMVQHQGQEIDKTDGFLVLFERPIQAVAYALAYQRELLRLSQEEKVSVRARTGVHVGDVLVWQNTPGDVVHGAKPIEVEGLVKPVTARLASLALPGQILVSGVAASLAQRAHGELGSNADRTRWINHGRYRFKGVPEPLVVYEVGEAGIAPLRLPPYSGKAWREVPWWRRPGTMFIEAAIVLGVLASASWLVLRPQPAIAFAERDWVIVGDFQNLTRQTNFDASLRTAIRIGLEQSHHVNVVPDQQIRNALVRMQKDPATTEIDRTVATQLALREGARAVVLPTISEVAGHLRVSAEIVDPTTQATVYSESVEGGANESALALVDAVNQAIRSRLGESLASIDANSTPLPQVTTDNLDALRALALAKDAQRDNRKSEALALFDQAITLDPHFALAYGSRAALYLSLDDRQRANSDLAAALAQRDRLPPREALLIDALAASFKAPEDMLNRWTAFGALYPDAYTAHSNYATFAWMYTNDYADAATRLEKALNPHNAHIGVAYHLMATLDLARNQYADAQRHMDLAASHNGRGSGLVLVELHAANRNFDGAAKSLELASASRIGNETLFRALTAMSVAVDSDQFDRYRHLGSEAARDLKTADGIYLRVLQGAMLGVDGRVAARDDSYRQRLADFLKQETSLLARRDDADFAHTVFACAYGAFLAAEAGDTALAGRTLETIEPLARELRYPNVTALTTIARAELARNQHDYAKATDILTGALNGKELYLTHYALLRVRRDAGDFAGAGKQADWLSANRGRAYAEFNSLKMLRPLNVALATIALSERADLAARQQQTDEAARYRELFARYWPRTSATPAFASPPATAD